MSDPGIQNGLQVPFAQGIKKSRHSTNALRDCSAKRNDGHSSNKRTEQIRVHHRKYSKAKSKNKFTAQDRSLHCVAVTLPLAATGFLRTTGLNMREARRIRGGQ